MLWFCLFLVCPLTPAHVMTPLQPIRFHKSNPPALSQPLVASIFSTLGFEVFVYLSLLPSLQTTTTSIKMPRQQRRAAPTPARSAPTRPTAAPARPAAAPQQQQAPHSTAAHQPQQQAPMQAPPQQSAGPGLFGQMASTAA